MIKAVQYGNRMRVHNASSGYVKCVSVFTELMMN